MNKLKGTGMVGSGNMWGTDVVSNKKAWSYKLGTNTMCHYFCLLCEGVTLCGLTPM